MSEEKTITLKKDTLWKAAAGIFAVLFVVALFTGGFGGSGNAVNDAGNNGGSARDAGANNVGPINAKSLIEDNDPVLGDTDAEISIVEFSDFECPFCARAYTGAVTQLKQSSYFQNGQVNLIYKQFPLNSIHSRAQKAAEASLCAQEQGDFWEYHDTLFENQGALDINSLKSYAQQLGLDTSKFNSCLDSGRKASEVSKEVQQATSSGGRGTPYFVVVNTRTGSSVPVSGAVPFAQFESAINSLL